MPTYIKTEKEKFWDNNIFIYFMTLNEGYNSNAMIQFMRNGFVFYALDGSNFCIEGSTKAQNRVCGHINHFFFEKLILPIIVCWQVFVILSLSMRFVFHSKITLVKYYQCSCLCEFFWWLLTKIIRKRGHQSFLKVCF